MLTNAASDIPIVELSVNVTDRNMLLLLLSQLCRSFGVSRLLNLLAKLTVLLPRKELIVCADEVFLRLADLQGETCNPVNYVSLSLEAMNTLSVISKSSLVKVPPDFMSWYETMCANFPTWFSHIFNGPMWSGLPIDQ
ncbi:hypothetical protein OS493_001350 [Desmophyllum pertusum]|uniref:Uncharacterized protein n=1 Tax=Desmophyllum pertusum TaxID=174260 RepID=A0A9W9ZJQ0_9CNID|nr:hypothetical protein OS493_001350 [Desmophyllum pertusum]